MQTTRPYGRVCLRFAVDTTTEMLVFQTQRELKCSHFDICSSMYCPIARLVLARPRYYNFCSSRYCGGPEAKKFHELLVKLKAIREAIVWIQP